MKTKLVIFSILFFSVSCNSPSIKESVDSCVTSQKFQVAKCGKRILDYKKDRATVGEWENISNNKTIPITEAGDQVCFSLEAWLLKIKPTLKEGHDFWKDGTGKKSKNKSNIIDNESVKFDDI